MKTSAIVVAAYIRPSCLERLLDSIAAAKYDTGDIPLVISIDKSDAGEVSSIAESFEWKHGEKKVIRQNEHLGLKEHIFRCGDLTNQYGSVIILEDDLIVSPFFYKFSVSALNYYSTEENIAGISLYSYRISENRFFPFYPHHDGSDVFFMQLPSSWGEVFTASSWNDFRNWEAKYAKDFSEKILPKYIREWSVHSWKKLFTAYMISNDKYFVYPRTSYSTNYGEPGANTDRRGLYQVPLMLHDKQVSFSDFDQSNSFYDAAFEIFPAAVKNLDERFRNYDFTVDLHGTKFLDESSSAYLLSSKKCKHAVFRFGNELPDPMQNVLFNSKGNFFSFGKKEDFENSQTEVAEFYININPVKDVLFNPYVKKLHEKFVFSQEFPQIFIGIVHEGDSLKLNETLKNIFRQLYPESQLEVRIFYPEEIGIINTGMETHDFIKLDSFTNADDFFKKFCNSLELSNAQYFVIARSGDTFYDHVFTEVNKIFKRYPDISWLTGIETIRSANGFNIFLGNTATRRWNSRIYERNLYKNSSRYIPPAATFWRRYAWGLAKPHLNLVSPDNFYEDIWLAFFKVQKLFTCDIYLSSSPIANARQLKNSEKSKQYTLVEDKFMNKLQEFFFINNVPYFRTYYKVKNNLPEVIRLDHESQWYFQSDF